MAESTRRRRFFPGAFKQEAAGGGAWRAAGALVELIVGGCLSQSYAPFAFERFRVAPSDEGRSTAEEFQDGILQRKPRL
jgi:hypothetical protein